jgi:hypothetical protein
MMRKKKLHDDDFWEMTVVREERAASPALKRESPESLETYQTARRRIKKNVISITTGKRTKSST